MTRMRIKMRMAVWRGKGTLVVVLVVLPFFISKDEEDMNHHTRTGPDRNRNRTGTAARVFNLVCFVRDYVLDVWVC